MSGLRELLRRGRRYLRADYESRLADEQSRYRDCENVHDLPEIFHYWSNKYLRPKQERFGFSNPEEFFFKFTLRQCELRESGSTRIASVGAGNCDMEAQLARKLVDVGQRHFVIECIDINDDMLERGRQHAFEMGVQEFVTPCKGDFNRWRPEGQFDVVIANQSLHHVLELEDLFGVIQKKLAPNGVLLTSDMIGRNGHLRWPEAREALQPFWQELPKPYRYNRSLKREELEFIDHDCSSQGFEGIRSQDILPLLVKRFHFELFIPFANITLVFVDRSFGHNFDADADWDRDFIDRVHTRDEEGLLSGELKPTQMLAVLRNEVTEPQLLYPQLTPENCIRWPNNAKS